MADKVASGLRSQEDGSVCLIASSISACTLRFVNASNPGLLDHKCSSIFLLAPSFEFFRSQLRQLGSEALRAWIADGSRSIQNKRTGQHNSVTSESVLEARGLARDFGHSLGDLTIFHGVNDDVVPFAESIYFANRFGYHLKLIEGDHRLEGGVRNVLSMLSIPERPKGEFLMKSGPITDFISDICEVLSKSRIPHVRSRDNLEMIAKEQPHTAYLAYDKSGCPIGASIVRFDGKRRGTAVLTNRRGQGIGAALLESSLKDHLDQFVEISTDSHRLFNLLYKNGFRLVFSKREILARINGTSTVAKDFEFGQCNRITTYERNLRLTSARKEFVMMARKGRPQ